MFGREPREVSSRQHVLPPSPTGYTFERASRKTAAPSESDLLSIVKGIGVSVGFSNAYSMKMSDGRYAAVLPNHMLFIDASNYSRNKAFDWTVETIPDNQVVREGYGMTSREIVEDIRNSGLVVGFHKSAGTWKERTAFLDGFDIPEPRHRVAGWDWDDHLNGFLAAEAAREFTCACGENVPAPGYTDCRCGKRWNAYSISANGSKKMIAREVPVRDNVVMAGRKTASTKVAADHASLVSELRAFLEQNTPRSGLWNDRQWHYALGQFARQKGLDPYEVGRLEETLMFGASYEGDDGYTSPEPGDTIEIRSGSYFEVVYERAAGMHNFVATNGETYSVDSINSINGEPINPDKIRLED